MSRDNSRGYRGRGGGGGNWSAGRRNGNNRNEDQSEGRRNSWSGGDGDRYSDNRRGGNRGGYQARSKQRGFGPKRNSFKSRYQKKGGYYNTNRNNRAEINPRSRLLDDDEDMGGNDGGQGGSRDRFNPYNGTRGRGRSRGRGGGGGHISNAAMERLGLPVKGGDRAPRTRDLGNYPWFRVQVLNAASLEKNFILTSIGGLVDVQFVPYHYMSESSMVVFYVNNKDAATAIAATNRKISAPTGHKLAILVRGYSTPNINVDNAVREALKLTMSKRYDATTKILNLTNLMADTDLNNVGYALFLSKQIVVKEVMNIMKENIPELVSLDISNNRLYSLEGWSKLPQATPNLTHLNLGNNNLKTDSELTCLTSLKLEELCLDGNPLCDKFDDNSTYISAIRKKFPKVLKLDGHVLPPPITFDIESSDKLPPTKGSSFQNNAQVQGLIEKFITEYFKIYDTGDRQTLLAAYHDQAIFSCTCAYNKVNPSHQPRFSMMPESRNLHLCKDPAKRQKLIKNGKLNVVSLLTSLPKTKHDLSKFTVDVNFVSESLLSFTVTGMFLEVDNPREEVFRCFSRVFVAVPQGPGVAIVNEELSVTNPTPKQVKEFREAKRAASQAGTSRTASPAPTPAAAGNSSVPGAVASPAGGADAQKAAMVQQFSAQSRMNADWSGKCLEQNGWNYELAAANFTELNSQGKIPPEAFV